MTTSIALVALGLSVLSLAWQAWTWRNSGPVVRVEVSNAITDAVTPGEAEHFVAVDVFNSGRAATSITGWGIAMQGAGNMYVTRPPRISASLPSRLEPHSKVSFFVGADELRRARQDRDVPFDQMHPWVDLGSGRRVHCKKPVPLAD